MHLTFASTHCWLFDLDLTLYGPEHQIMSQIRNRIAVYVEEYFGISSEAAHQIRYAYWRKYGTTLGGMMAEHGVDPNAYLDFVHDVDLSLLLPCDQLRSAIDALPGRKLIFTNANAPFAKRVLAARGLDGLFEDIFDIHRMEHRPKPEPQSYHALCQQLAIDPETALFIEDSAHNLEPAKAMGMTTVWLHHKSDGEATGPRPDYVDYEIEELTPWLKTIKEMEKA
jgi:putative hydrolase of the HAD superfamily